MLRLEPGLLWALLLHVTLTRGQVTGTAIVSIPTRAIRLERSPEPPLMLEPSLIPDMAAHMTAPCTRPSLATTYEGRDSVLLERMLPLVDFIEVTPDSIA